MDGFHPRRLLLSGPPQVGAAPRGPGLRGGPRVHACGAGLGLTTSPWSHPAVPMADPAVGGGGGSEVGTCCRPRLADVQARASCSCLHDVGAESFSGGASPSHGQSVPVRNPPPRPHPCPGFCTGRFWYVTGRQEARPGPSLSPHCVFLTTKDCRRCQNGSLCHVLGVCEDDRVRSWKVLCQDSAEVGAGLRSGLGFWLRQYLAPWAGASLLRAPVSSLRMRISAAPESETGALNERVTPRHLEDRRTVGGTWGQLLLSSSLSTPSCPAPGCGASRLSLFFIVWSKKYKPAKMCIRMLILGAPGWLN